MAKGRRSGPNKTKAGSQPLNLAEYEAAARRRISRMAYEYIAAGSADEITLRRNRECFDELLLKPRVLRDVSALDTQVELLGQKLPFPILLAPAAYHQLVHSSGELGTIEGTNAAGATLVASSFATATVEEMARAAKTPLWFQLYVQRDKGFTRDLVQRAENAGCAALVITVDTPVLGPREREKRVGFQLPRGMVRKNMVALSAEAATVAHQSERESDIYNILLDPALTWEGIDRIRKQTRLPVVLKGILSPEDARLAVKHGAAGVIVSNHGGRNLDTLPATIEALPAVVEAAEGRIPVLLDGGVRRGTDVLKALALGAQAVLIGRPYLWGLGVAGAKGVERVLSLLRTEFEAAMALCGLQRLEQITRHAIWPRRG